MEKATTLKEIAYELDLSINTISRALRDCDDISRETKKLVIDTAIKLGYMPKSINQFTRKDNDMPLIGIISGESKNFYFLLNTNKIASCLMESHFASTIINSNTLIVGVDVVKQCISQRIEGIISLVPLDDDALQTCKLNNIPVVCVGKYEMKDKADCIYIDVNSGTNLWINYINNIHTSKKIIYVGLNEATLEDERRYELLVKNAHNINPNIDIEKVSPNRNLIMEKISQVNGYISICCFSDEVAYSLINDLNNNITNIRRILPHLHILGFDSLCSHLVGLIDLTSIDYDYDEIASKSCLLLSERFKNLESPFRFVEIPVGLHVRRII